MTDAGLELRGIFPPLTTPFTPEGSVDAKALISNVERYNRTGVAGYVVMGSTGESVLLDTAEKLDVWKAVKEAAVPEKILIAGTGDESTARTVELTKEAAGLGYQVALVRTPSYYKSQMGEAAQERHFLAVADASPIPVLVYAVPQFTGVAVTGPLVERLSAHKNILGIKESSGVVTLVADILHRVPEEFQVLAGSATTFYPSLSLGARGGILAIACAMPDLCVELYHAVEQGDTARARALQELLHDPTLMLVNRHGIGGLKYAMDKLGFHGGKPRPPLAAPEEGARAEIDDLLHTVTEALASASH